MKIPRLKLLPTIKLAGKPLKILSTLKLQNSLPAKDALIRHLKKER